MNKKTLKYIKYYCLLLDINKNKNCRKRDTSTLNKIKTFYIKCRCAYYELFCNYFDTGYIEEVEYRGYDGIEFDARKIYNVIEEIDLNICNNTKIKGIEYYIKDNKMFVYELCMENELNKQIIAKELPITQEYFNGYNIEEEMSNKRLFPRIRWTEPILTKTIRHIIKIKPLTNKEQTK